MFPVHKDIPSKMKTLDLIPIICAYCLYLICYTLICNYYNNLSNDKSNKLKK